MAWVKLGDGDPVVRVRQDGQMRWNAATHAMMGNPESVELFYDAVAGKLGLRGVYYVGELRVLFNEDMEYGIDAGEHFADAGVSFAQDWAATPELLPPGAGLPVAYDGFCNENSIWIAIPHPAPLAAPVKPARSRRSRSKANG